MADTAAALVINLSADFKDFKKQMQQATGIFDAEGRKIAKRQEQLKKSLSNWSLDFTGLKGLNKALVGLTAAGVGVGLATLVKKSLDAASAIGDTAIQAGVSIERLQQLRFAASQSGSSFETMDTALTTLNKNLGDFVNTGAGKAAATFKTLGIDKLIKSGDVRDAEDAFNVIIAKLQGFKSEAQKSAFLASVFGKQAGPQLLQLVNQGTEGLAKLEAQAVSLGIVLSTKTVLGAKEASDKLDALFNVIKAQGVAAVANLAPEIAKLAQAITDGLPDLILWVEKWAAYFNLIDLSPVQKLQLAIKDVEAQLRNADDLKNSALLNPLGIMSANIDATKGKLLAQLADFRAELAQQEKLAVKDQRGNHVKPGDNLGLTWKGGQFDKPPLTINDPAAKAKAEQEAKALQALRERQAQFLAGTVVDAKTSAAALQAAQDAAQVQLLRGSTDYFKAVSTQINNEFQARKEVLEAETAKQMTELARQKLNEEQHAEAVANINQTLQNKIAEAETDRRAKQQAAGEEGFLQETKIQSAEQIQQLNDEAGALGLTAGAAAKLAFIQGQLNDARRAGITLSKEAIQAIEAEGEAIGQAAQRTTDTNEKINRSIQAADTFKQGLEDVGVAGLHGFDSLAEAGENFLWQIAEMILRLGVLKPLLDGLGGSGGGTGGGAGGFLGNIFGSIFGGGDLASLTTSAIAANPLLFDEGGPTPPGSKNKPVGIVHAGENVWSQDDVRRAGGMRRVEALRRRGGRGYADGGAVGVGTPVAPLPAMRQPNARNSGAMHFNTFVDARYATKGTEELIREELVKSYPTLVKAAVQESNRQFPANLSSTLKNKA